MRQSWSSSQATVAVGSHGVRFLGFYVENTPREAPNSLIFKPRLDFSSSSGSAHQIRVARAHKDGYQTQVKPGDSGPHDGNKLDLLAKPWFEVSRRNFNGAKETLYRILDLTSVAATQLAALSQSRFSRMYP